MSHNRPLSLSLAACAFSIVASTGAQQSVAQEVGTAAAVNPSAQARGSSGSRTIVLGQSIAHRERIQTTSAGSVQLVFLDKTSMTVGPNSDLAIDEYVFDPATNSGKLAATLSKGVMRFVGGQISHAGNAQVTTPGAVVGIRGGVAIFHPTSVYLGYGRGEVTSGSSTIVLGAGDFTQTPGQGAPPTPPTAPPPGYLQNVLATLQSGAGQGGGAPATAARVNRARTAASGSANGRIAGNVRDSVPRPVEFANETLIYLNLTILASVNETRRVQTSEPISPGPTAGPPQDVPNGPPPLPAPSPPAPSPPQPGIPRTLVGYTGGIIQSNGQNGALGQNYPALGVTVLQVNADGSNGQANFTISASNTSQNTLQNGNIQFGSIDPNLPSGRVTINGFDQMSGSAEALQPAVGSNGKPLSQINGQTLTRHDGLFVEFKPGSELSNNFAQRLGTSFCRCEYTRWGLWDSQSERPGPNNATISESARMFWVAGRFPNSVGDVPTTGSATYDGHAIANIRNGNQSYIAAGAFQNVVNFGSRTGSVSVNGLDATNYTGRVSMLQSDPRFFAGTLSGGGRSMALSGNFFQGASSPVGEMGGGLQVTGPSYSGAGVFLGRMR
jgi:hypothetical protein